MPLFSVIIPVYNRPDLVVETIESVLAQTWKDMEIVIIDDGSTDRTPEVLARYADRATLIRQENQGLGAARNHAMTVAKGEYLLFLDSDDLLLPWSMARFAEAIAKHNKPAIVLGALRDFSKARPVGDVHDAALQERAYADYLASWHAPAWLAPSGTVVRADVLRRAWGFFTDRMTHEENDAWMRIADAPGFVHIDAPICCARRVHDGNISAFSMRNVQGAVYLLDQERKHAYPGGPARRRERRALLSLHMRPMVLACLHAGEFKWAWHFYWQTFTWNVSLGRWRFLAAFPVMALVKGIGSLFKSSNRSQGSTADNAGGAAIAGKRGS